MHINITHKYQYSLRILKTHYLAIIVKELITADGHHTPILIPFK